MSARTFTRTRLPVGRILLGDATRELRRLPSQSVDQVVTSPPYFRLRNYDHAAQLGLEEHIDHWVDALVGVLDEVARVLTPTGTLWLNLGDTYATHARQGAVRKSLLLGPERLAIKLAERGWILRNKIIWAKTTHLPSSVRDRLSSSYELIYVFALDQRYFFDLDAVRIPHRSQPPNARADDTAHTTARESWRGPNGVGTAGLDILKAAGRIGHPLGKNPGDVWQLPSSNYRGSHHATYPILLVERMIRAGCPEARCMRCLLPWQRITRRLGATAVRGALKPTCRCRTGREPGVVLDPFFGVGTTAVAAEQLERNWVGIEINPDFTREAYARIEAARRARSNSTSKEVA
jgi:DNA modification methylase